MDWKRLLRSDYGILFAFVLVMAGAALLGGQLVLVQRDRARLSSYVDRLMARSVDVASASRNVLWQVGRLAATPCSDADIAELRFLAFQSRFLRDIGRLRDDQLICSATWGRLQAPVALPPPDLTVPEYRFWTARGHLIDSRIVADMAASRDAIVTTSPTAFDSAVPSEAGIGALVAMAGNRHVFHVFGDITGLRHTSETWYDIGGTRHARRCSPHFDLCVFAHKRRSSLLAESPLLIGGVGTLGALAGSGLGSMLVGYRVRRRSLPMQLRRALAAGTLSLHYQPLRVLRDRRLVGAEALARWCNEAGEWVAPDVFVPLAEQLRLEGAMTRLVVRKALAEMGERLRGADGFYLSLNLSATDIIDPDFHRYLDEQVRRYDVRPQRIVLEITERSTTGHAELAGCIGALRDKGYRFYIDDFGTGYSTLAYLAELPIDAIKIDRMFTRSIGTGSMVELIIEPIQAIAALLQVDLVIEGVENEQQAAFVQRLAPDALGQGWLLGRPVTAGRFPRD